MVRKSKNLKSVAVQTNLTSDDFEDKDSIVLKDSTIKSTNNCKVITIKQKPKRKSYSYEEKLKVIKLLKYKSTDKVSEELDIDKSLLCRWARDESKIKEFNAHNHNKKLKKGRSAANEEMEERLFSWFCESRADNIPISGNSIKKEALRLSEELGDSSFKASAGWLARWKKRYTVKLQPASD